MADESVNNLGQSIIVMKEGFYDCIISTRPNRRGRNSFKIEVPGGIPVWGHGQSSGEMDGIFSVTFSAEIETLVEAVEAFYKTVNDARKAYGDPNLPEAMTVEQAEAWYEKKRDQNIILEGFVNET